MNGVKFTSKMKYTVSKEEEWDGSKMVNRVTGRYAEVTIISDSEENCYKLQNNLESTLLKADENFQFARCSEVEKLKNGKFELVDYVKINDKEEFEEIMEIYKEWKVNNK